MVVNFRAREISRGTRKLARTSILNLKKKNNVVCNNIASPVFLAVDINFS
jgi:hypothetical protein